MNVNASHFKLVRTANCIENELKYCSSKSPEMHTSHPNVHNGRSEIVIMHVFPEFLRSLPCLFESMSQASCDQACQNGPPTNANATTQSGAAAVPDLPTTESGGGPLESELCL